MADRPFDPFPWSLEEVVENNLSEVPIYQGPYTWGGPEVGALLKDLFDAYHAQQDQPQSTLFVG